MEKTGVPVENHRLKPQVTGKFLICPGSDSKPDSGERQSEVNGNVLDHTATRASPNSVNVTINQFPNLEIPLGKSFV